MGKPKKGGNGLPAGQPLTKPCPWAGFVLVGVLAAATVGTVDLARITWRTVR